MASAWFLILLMGVLIAANGLFVAAEVSLVAVNRASVEQDAAAGDPRSQRVLGALRSLGTQLSGAQIGITLTSLLIGLLAEPAIAELIEGPLTDWQMDRMAAAAVSMTIALIVASVAQMVFGELIPKNVAIAEPRRTAEAVSGFQRAFTTVATPQILVTNGAARVLLRLGGVEPVNELVGVPGPDELISLVRYSGEQGVLPQNTALLIERTLRFGRLTAADAMTPRTRMQTVRECDPVTEVLRRSRATGLSRFPVVGSGGSPDNVVGMVSLREALRLPSGERETQKVAAVVVPIVRIPASMSTGDALALALSGEQMMLVVDGGHRSGTAGLLTIEDLTEQIVGDITDEFDPQSFRHERQADGSWLLSGLLHPQEARRLGVPIPDHAGTETIAGWLASRLGEVGVVGDEVTVPGWRFTVQAVIGHRIDMILAEPGDGV